MQQANKTVDCRARLFLKVDVEYTYHWQDIRLYLGVLHFNLLQNTKNATPVSFVYLKNVPLS